MKPLFLSVLLIGSAFAAQTSRGNVLQNGDFAEGLTHWNGDIRPLSVVSDSAAPGNGAGMKLLGTWTQMTQEFDARKGHYEVNITFTITPDTTFTNDAMEYRRIPEKLGFTALKNFRVAPGDWCIIVTNAEAGQFVHCAIKPLKNDSSVQTMTGVIDLDADCDRDTFCLAFPPGHGVVTIQGVTMTPQ